LFLVYLSLAIDPIKSSSRFSNLCPMEKRFDFGNESVLLNTQISISYAFWNSNNSFIKKFVLDRGQSPCTPFFLTSRLLSLSSFIQNRSFPFQYVQSASISSLSFYYFVYPLAELTTRKPT